MIKKFVVENFLSLGKEVVFKPENKISLIYGENASGKSNFLIALKSMQKLVISNDYKDDIYIPKNAFIDEKTTSFFLEIELNDLKIEYLLQIEEDIKRSEILLVDGEEFFNFENVGEEVLNVSSSYMTKVELERLESYVLSNRSILNILATEFDLQNLEYQNKINNLFFWYKYQLRFLNSGLSENEIGYIYSRLNDNDKEKINEFFKVLNLTVYGIELIKKDTIIKNKKGEDETSETYDVFIKHSNNIKLAFNLESTGTQKIICLALQILITREPFPVPVLILDEFDRSLHYELAKGLLCLFEQNTGQLILTTHTLDFLENEKHLSKTAFWFVEKSDSEVSSIFSLNNIKGLRNDDRHNWKKFYQASKFGAYPKKIEKKDWKDLLNGDNR